MGTLIQQTSQEYYSQNAKEKTAERKAELEQKHISDEI
jgi:hypothetical protein